MVASPRPRLSSQPGPCRCRSARADRQRPALPAAALPAAHLRGLGSAAALRRKAYLTQLVTSFSEAADVELTGDPRDVQAVLSMAKSESESSWYQRYCQEYMRTLYFSEHEALNHPVACLLVVTSTDKDPINAFVDLFNTEHLPALFNEGAMDPKIHKHFVLLHDMHSGPITRAEEIISEMKGTLGANNCHLLKINSRPVDQAEPQADIWSSHRLPVLNLPMEEKMETTPAGQLLGQYLDPNDLRQEFVSELAVKQIIPHMELKIRNLNQHVSAARKGLRNQLKSLWFRKGKDEPQVSPNSSSTYSYGSMEQQIRVLSDYSFMLQDYELALSSYRLLVGDFRQDKAWKRFAGVQEMIGLCLYMLDQSRREAESCLETAYNHYQRSGSGGTKFATRTAMWLVEMHKDRGQFREAAQTLMRASLEETNLRAGILLEQAAYCFLRSTPPMIRKYGFHMVLAGNRYNLCGQRKHAARAYTYVLGIYKGLGWHFISDHCNFTLGRLAAHLGNYQGALDFFMLLLDCSHQSTSTQSTFLREFLYVVQSLDREEEYLSALSLPRVTTEKVYVHSEGIRTFSNAAAGAQSTSAWDRLEEGLVPAVAAMVTPTWLDGPAFNDTTGGAAYALTTNTCVAGEEISVDVEFSNPLLIDLHVSEVQLKWDFTPTCATESTGQGVARTVSTPSLEHLDAEVKTPLKLSSGRGSSMSDFTMTDVAEVEKAEASKQGNGHVEQSEQLDDEDYPLCSAEDLSFILKPTEEVIVRLRMRAHKAGTLQVKGVRWMLSGIARGSQEFRIKAPRKKRPKGGGREPVIPPHHRLTFLVIPPMPRLGVDVHRLPERAAEGELHCANLELFNSSSVPLKALRMKTSHPQVAMAGQVADLNVQLPAHFEITPNGDHGSPWPDQNNGMFKFPQDVTLLGRSKLQWPIWLHLRGTGDIVVNLVFYYEPDVPSTTMPFRTLCVSFQLQIVPSMRMGLQIRPSPSQLALSVMRLDIENVHATESFWLRQVSLVGAAWKLTPLLPPGTEKGAAFLVASVSPPQLLSPSQATSLFFHVQMDNGQEERKTLISNAALGKEAVLDMSRQPLCDFHRREHSVLLTKGDSYCSEPDVVVVWEHAVRSPAGEGSAPSLLQIGTHHLCDQRFSTGQPVRWAVQGPSFIQHDFASQGMCEINITIAVRNCSTHLASVKVETVDPTAKVSGGEPVEDAQMVDTGIWHVDELAEASTAASSSKSKIYPPSEKSARGLPCGNSPSGRYIWTGMTSTCITALEPGATVHVPLRAAVYANGVYDLSAYTLSWRTSPLSLGNADPPAGALRSEHNNRSTAADVVPRGSESGSGVGHPFFVAVIKLDSNVERTT
eukprot:SM000156S02116  [mRNA]  locus=s156:54554:63177:+ [translate_table: standard]